MTKRFQFCLRTWLVAVSCVSLYFGMFLWAWNWMLLLGAGVGPFAVTLSLVHVWVNMAPDKRTGLCALLCIGVSMLSWLPWLIFFVLGPGQAVYKGAYDVTPAFARGFLDEWNDVWKR